VIVRWACVPAESRPSLYRVTLERLAPAGFQKIRRSPDENGIWKIEEKGRYRLRIQMESSGSSSVATPDLEAQFDVTS